MKTTDDDEPYTGPERRRDGLSAKADELTQAVGALNTSVQHLTAYGRRNRFLIRWNIIASAVIIVMAAVVAVVAVNTAENRQNAKLTCQIGNESRAAQRLMWNFVLDASVAANPNMTPSQAVLIQDFRRYVGEVFAERDCNNLKPVVVTPTPPKLPVLPSATPTR